MNYPIPYAYYTATLLIAFSTSILVTLLHYSNFPMNSRKRKCPNQAIETDPSTPRTDSPSSWRKCCWLLCSSSSPATSWWECYENPAASSNPLADSFSERVLQKPYENRARSTSSPPIFWCLLMVYDAHYSFIVYIYIIKKTKIIIQAFCSFSNGISISSSDFCALGFIWFKMRWIS